MRNKLSIMMLSILALVLAAGIVVGATGFKQLRFEGDRGKYVAYDTDSWLIDSTVISGNPTEFTTELVYKWDGKGINQPYVDGSYLILTTNLNPAISGIQVTLSNMRYSDIGSAGIPDKTIGTGDWTQFGPNDNGLTIFDYPTADHGILKSPNWYTVVQIDSAGDGQYLLNNMENSLLVDISISASDGKTRLHLDSIGTYINEGSELGFTGNPYSSDVTWQIPEFTTIAIPIAIVIGLIFFFQNQKKDK